jgi:predicted TIM-barrel fold metal-dependent hydrolase
MDEGELNVVVIDVDTHLESGPQLAAEFCDAVGGSMPHCPELRALMFAGELLRALPEDRRPRGQELYPEDPNAEPWTVRASVKDDVVANGDAAARVAWMDEHGIDQALVNFGSSNVGAGVLLTELKDIQRLSSMTNDFIAERLVGHSDRLMQVAVLKDATDMDWAVAELTRMRARGCRGFSVPTKPANGCSIGHPAWDRLWSAATDLGMIYVMHIGFTPASLDAGAADSGWMLPGGAGAGGALRFLTSESQLAAQRALATMVFGGVFARHPYLTVLLEETQAGWLPSFIDRLERLTQPHLERFINVWPYDLTAGEILHRNVRATPLVSQGDDAMILLDQIPDMMVFSSDFPHPEGNDVIFEPGLDRLDDPIRRSYLGGNIADCFERMGDPLPAPLR